MKTNHFIHGNRYINLDHISSACLDPRTGLLDVLYLSGQQERFNKELSEVLWLHWNNLIRDAAITSLKAAVLQ